jgi:hypothetical protein
VKTHARIKNGEIIFTSPLSKQMFLQKNEGKDILLAPNDDISAEMRRYFEGALTPIVYYTHPKSGWNSFKDARDALKLEFLPSSSVVAVRGKMRGISVPTTADLSKESFRKFIDAISHWLLENYLCVEDDLDPENWKRWRDSAPDPAEIYPPLKRLKERYDVEKAKAFPWRKDLSNQKSK